MIGQVQFYFKIYEIVKKVEILYENILMKIIIIFIIIVLGIKMYSNYISTIEFSFDL